jgi:hypothetical protein
MKDLKTKTQAEREWLAHEQTKRLHQDILERQRKLLLQLVRAAESSTDGNVLRIAVEYRLLERELKWLE